MKPPLLPIVAVALAALIAGLAAGSPFAAALTLVLAILVDWILVGFSGPPSRMEASARLSLSATSAVVAGSVFPVRVRIEGPAASATVVPLLPPGLVPVGRRFAKRAASPDLLFRFRGDSVGVAVFPGVLLVRTSALGLFRSSVLLADRLEVPVLPNPLSSEHRVLARFFKSGPGEFARRRVRAVKGAGTDFAEIREYRSFDSQRRIDWKATARRCRVLVREYEEPPEFTVRVVLDGSTDLTATDSFRLAADLVGKLAHISVAAKMTFTLTAYDRQVILDERIRGFASGVARLLAALVRLPRLALARSIASNAEDADRLAETVYRETMRRWRGPDSGEPFEEYLERYGVDRPAFLADFAPDRAESAPERCGRCGAVVFPDEPECSSCGGPIGAADLSPRAACLAGILDRTLRRSRGREILVLVSSFRGGETAPGIVTRLTLAAAGHRKVHVVMPTRGEDDRVEFPGSIGSYPSLSRSMREVDAFVRAEERRAAVRHLIANCVDVHPLDDSFGLDEIVAGLLRAEVLGP